MHGVVVRDLDSEDFRGLLMFKPPGDLEQQSGPFFFLFWGFPCADDCGVWLSSLPPSIDHPDP